jgi:EAL domain-containing protein (putative c-di-GMP-specific phosphodiesterase class I)
VSAERDPELRQGSARTRAQRGESRLLSLAEQVDALASGLAKHAALGVVLLDATPLAGIGRVEGVLTVDQLLEGVAELLHSRLAGELGEEIVLTRGLLAEEQILIFLARPRSERGFYLHELPRLADELRAWLRQALRSQLAPYVRRPPELPLGYAMVFHRAAQRAEGQIRRLVESARASARFEAERAQRERAGTLERVVLEESLTTVYEPVVQLEHGRILGYEALSRGPAGTPLVDPLVLFDVAASCDLEFELDALCRRQAIRNAPVLALDQRLFVNILPSSVCDPDFDSLGVCRLLRDAGLVPENLVLEISERQAIASFARFRQSLDRFSALGFGVALDDTGAGFASLEAALELRPDYLKVDISLVRGIQNSPERQALVRGLQAVAQQMGAMLIAEGIETAEELAVLRSLGIACGQGFHLGRGAPLDG